MPVAGSLARTRPTVTMRHGRLRRAGSRSDPAIEKGLREQAFLLA
jgi:hypothetical protein